MLTAPFPWFGGKRRAAPLVWPRFGEVKNYVEPFAGSLAVLLARPHAAQTETVNDRDAYLANFWRAVQAEPDTVWAYADSPVSEADLHARHVWLLQQADFRERMLTDPTFYDVQVAGWWVWGLSLWIGDGWCAERTNERTNPIGRPTRQLPYLTGAMGVRAARFQNSEPSAVSDAAASRTCESARDLLSQSVSQSQPAKFQSSDLCGLSGSSRVQGGVFDVLAERLRRVRITCGDWSRVVTPSVTWRHGVTGVLLDPPYTKGEHSISYGVAGDVAGDVRAWAIENGDNPLLRIALCGYAGEHEMPDGWTSVRWKAQGGYGSQGKERGRENADRETIWFSPHCLSGEAQPSMFEAAS